MTTSNELTERYGRSTGATQRTRFVLIAAALAFALVIGGWLLWAGILGAPAQFTVDNIGHSVVDDSVEVTWQFTAPPGESARCAIQALNSSFGTVGWRIVDLAPSARYTREFTESVATTERAVTGLIYRCWLT